MSSNNTAHFAFPLEYVADIDSAKRFFVDVLGLSVDRDHPTFVQFSAPNGASYAIASDEPMDPGNGHGTELWWVVEDAEAAFSEMSSKAQVTLPPRKMPFGTCFGIKDPAGQVHYVLQLAQERPSRPVS